MTTRVFVVDGQELVRRGVRELLRDDPELLVCGEAGSAVEALARLGHAFPDVLLVDVDLPDADGIALVRGLSARVPSLRFVVMSSRSDDAQVFAAVQAGAWGFVPKAEPADQLLEVLRAVAGGRSALNSERAKDLLDRLRARRDHALDADRLTAQERRILVLIGEGLSNKEIAVRLELAEKTVKNHVTKLLSKLGLERRTQAAVYAERLRRGT